MDSAIPSLRAYPGYTTTELKQKIAGWDAAGLRPGSYDAIAKEIAAREAGDAPTLHARLARPSA